MQEMKGDGALFELGPKKTSQNTFCAVIQGLLREKAMVFNLERKCSLGIWDLNYCKEKIEVGKAVRREC